MLTLNQYVIKEHVGMFRFQNEYDAINPATNAKIGSAIEKKAGWAILLSMLIGPKAVPTKIELIPEGQTQAVGTITRGFTFIRSKIDILNAAGQAIGYFKSKLLTINGGFDIFDMNDQLIANVKGNWKSWDFKIADVQGNEIGVVSKKWVGFGKELFTSADNYMLAIHDNKHSLILLMAAVALDTVFTEEE
jgi:uncharacterized protein YxjI